MSCSTPDLRENLDTAFERQEKIFKTLDGWFQQVAKVKPPPVTDPSMLSGEAHCQYYYTVQTKSQNNVLSRVTGAVLTALTGLPAKLDTGTMISSITQAVAGTSKDETGKGYGTCVVRSQPGEFDGKKCLYKALVVVASFNFSRDEYKTNQDVAGFGYWIYLLVTKPPLGVRANGRPQYYSIHNDKVITFDVPDDVEVIGEEYMTLEELDDLPA